MRDPWNVWFGPGRRRQGSAPATPGGPGVWIHSPSGITISEHMLTMAIEQGPPVYRDIFKAFAEVLPELAAARTGDPANG